jgi:hypothetical protein
MFIDNLIEEGLSAPSSALVYGVSRRLASLFPGRVILGTRDSDFRLLDFAAAEQCSLVPREAPFAAYSTYWAGLEGGVWQRPDNAWFEVRWQDQSLDVLMMSWPEGHCMSVHFWLMAASSEVARDFFAAVCAWGQEIRREVLVFEGGHWERSEELYAAIKSATFDNLILPAALKREVRQDFTQFFAARETYERYRVPWKRGLLFVGPPGNGKTHAIKALLNTVEYPCLYVKSLVTPWGTDHDCIREVFQQARRTTPCVLVLEDLDSIINSENRSFFLNELDGFALNSGILTLATTNHPERLDPAIVERPSRFDRKYHFDLPAPDERLAYIRLWQEELDPELRLSEAAVPQAVELTDGFSFAYMKELFLSSMLRWVSAPTRGSMDDVLAAQSGTLRKQMNSLAASEAAADAAGVAEDEAELPLPAQGA